MTREHWIRWGFFGCGLVLAWPFWIFIFVFILPGLERVLGSDTLPDALPPSLHPAAFRALEIHHTDRCFTFLSNCSKHFGIKEWTAAPKPGLCLDLPTRGNGSILNLNGQTIAFNVYRKNFFGQLEKSGFWVCVRA